MTGQFAGSDGCCRLDSPITRLTVGMLAVPTSLSDWSLRLPCPLWSCLHPMIAGLTFALDLTQLRHFAQEKLCEIGMLEPDQFPMTERNVVKAGQPCGVMYCLHGPRSVKLTAIADFEKKSLICYGSDGARSVETALPL